MKHTITLFSLILAFALLLSACAPAATPTAVPQAAAATKVPTQPTATTMAATPTTAPASPQQIQVSEADQGKNIRLNAGDSLVIMLDSNPSTGNAWVVKPVDNAVLAMAGEPTFVADSNKLGVPGKTTLTFKTVGSGSQALTLLYQSSSEKDTQPLKTFTIHVTVSGTASGSSAQPTAAISNPAAKYCTEQGFTSETRTAADGSQYGVCKFPNGSECDEWAYFRGQCKAGQ